MSEENTNGIDLSGLGSFDFTPAWAKKEEKILVAKGRYEDRDQKKGDARPDRPRRPFGEKKPFAGKKPFAPRKPFVKAERPQPLDCEIKILPDTKALGTIIRKIQGDAHAYKLKELAYFFLDNPESILLRITPKAEKICQCKACGFASTREEDVLDHLLSAHLADYYDAKEISCEPPKGNFTCVAKCGLTGVLLGPPNIHEFNAVVREMIRTRFPDMSEEQYRAHLEMVRDSETIEKWRAGAVTKTVFFAKGQAEVEGAAQMTREQAEGEFKRTILPSLKDTPKRVMITAAVAAKSPTKPLVWAVNDALAVERRQPYSMIFALRGAFHHRKLNFFRANDPRGPEFVTSAALKEFDAEHAIPELAQVAKFLGENPCLDKSEFPAEIADFEKHLQWLVSTGHAVAFTNGVFSAVEKFPKYGPQWKRRGKKAAVAKAEPEVAAEPVAVEPTEATKPEPAAVEQAEVKTEEKVEEVKKEESNEVSAQLAE